MSRPPASNTFIYVALLLLCSAARKDKTCKKKKSSEVGAFTVLKKVFPPPRDSSWSITKVQNCHMQASRVSDMILHTLLCWVFYLLPTAELSQQVQRKTLYLWVWNTVIWGQGECLQPYVSFKSFIHHLWLQRVARLQREINVSCWGDSLINLYEHFVMYNMYKVGMRTVSYVSNFLSSDD